MSRMETLNSLCGCMGIPGRELSVLAFIEQELKDFQCRRDALGNLIVTVRKADDGKKTLLLEAHADRIGFVLTGFLEGGFIRVAAAGGIDRHTTMGSEIVIEGKEGRVSGIISAPFPHPAKPHNSAPPADYVIPEVDELFVDTGLCNPREHLKLGAQAVFAGGAFTLLGDRIAAPALDNRLACLALIETAKKLRKSSLQAGLMLQFSTREESGGKAAKTAAFSVMPDKAIVIDAGFAYSPDVKEGMSSSMGKGTEIDHCGTLDAEMTNTLISIARDKQIPYQEVVFGDNTGTDAESLSTAASGIPTALLSIPVRYMHHPFETADMKDLNATVDLLVEYAMEM